MEKPNNTIQVKVTDDVLRGTYSNNVIISHTGGEFLLDFMTLFPPQGIIGARVIVSPGHAKRMMKALQDNIAKYEQKFGDIREAEVPRADGVVH